MFYDLVDVLLPSGTLVARLLSWQELLTGLQELELALRLVVYAILIFSLFLISSHAIIKHAA